MIRDLYEEAKQLLEDPRRSAPWHGPSLIQWVHAVKTFLRHMVDLHDLDDRG